MYIPSGEKKVYLFCSTEDKWEEGKIKPMVWAVGCGGSHLGTFGSNTPLGKAGWCLVVVGDAKKYETGWTKGEGNEVVVVLSPNDQKALNTAFFNAVPWNNLGLKNMLRLSKSQMTVAPCFNTSTEIHEVSHQSVAVLQSLVDYQPDSDAIYQTMLPKRFFFKRSRETKPLVVPERCYNVHHCTGALQVSSVCLMEATAWQQRCKSAFCLSTNTYQKW